MKITESRIRRIIKEELSRIIETREPDINISQTGRHVNIDHTYYPSEEELAIGYTDPVTYTTTLDVSTVAGKDGEMRTVHLGKLDDVQNLPLHDDWVFREDGIGGEPGRGSTVIYLVDVGAKAYWLPGASVSQDDSGRDIPVLVYGDITDTVEMVKFRVLPRDSADIQSIYPFGGTTPGLEASRNWSETPTLPLDDHEPHPVEYTNPFTADWCAQFPDKCPPDPDYKVRWEDTDFADLEGETFEPQDYPSPFTMDYEEWCNNNPDADVCN